MIRAIALGLVAGGIALTMYGVEASRSFGSEVSKVFTGNPTDRAMSLMVGGVVMIVVGAAGLFFGKKRR
jgi:LPXTG-motif cell wall-anchored protein